MQVKNLSEKTIIVLLIVLLILSGLGFSYYYGQKNRQYTNLLKQVGDYTLDKKAFEVKRLQDSSTIATQTQTILTEKEAYALKLADKDKTIKVLQSQVKTSNNVSVNNIVIKYKDTGRIRFLPGDTVFVTADNLTDTNWLFVPQYFSQSDAYKTIKGSVNYEGVIIDSIYLPNTTTVTIGKRYKSNNFFYKLNPFKTLEPVVIVKNTNPYFNTTAMNNVVVEKEKESFFSKLWNAIKTAGLFYTIFSLSTK